MVKEKLIVETDCSVRKNDKHQYVKPSLIKYGDVRDITLGASSPFGESGAAATRCNEGFTCPP